MLAPKILTDFSENALTVSKSLLIEIAYTLVWLTFALSWPYLLFLKTGENITTTVQLIITLVIVSSVLALLANSARTILFKSYTKKSILFTTSIITGFSLFVASMNTVHIFILILCVAIISYILISQTIENTIITDTILETEEARENKTTETTRFIISHIALLAIPFIVYAAFHNFDFTELTIGLGILSVMFGVFIAYAPYNQLGESKEQSTEKQPLKAQLKEIASYIWSALKSESFCVSYITSGIVYVWFSFFYILFPIILISQNVSFLSIGIFLSLSTIPLLFTNEIISETATNTQSTTVHTTTRTIRNYLFTIVGITTLGALTQNIWILLFALGVSNFIASLILTAKEDILNTQITNGKITNNNLSFWQTHNVFGILLFGIITLILFNNNPTWILTTTVVYTIAIIIGIFATLLFVYTAIRD